LAAQACHALAPGKSRSWCWNGGATASIACGISRTHIGQIRMSGPARSTPIWPRAWPPPRPAIPAPPGARPSPTAGVTPSATAPPAPHPAASHQDRHKPDTSGGPDPPCGPRFTFTSTGQSGPPGGYGTWRFATGIPGQRDPLPQIGPIPADGCDHWHQARGHGRGVMLGTWPRSGMPHAPAWAAGDRPRTASITFRMRPMSRRVCAAGIRSVGTTTTEPNRYPI